MRKSLTLFAFIAMFVLCHQMAYAQAATYRLPLASNPGITAWFDHDSTSSLLRFDCATSFQYNDHHGTDFGCSVNTNVYSGAVGTIYYYVDGCPDNSNPSCGGGYGNHLRIQSAKDGRVAIYAHLESGTLLTNSSVTCGAKVAQSGASGQETGPHLHFELWQNTGIGTRLDFFGGSCNSPSYWVNQNGYSPTTQCQ